MSYQPLDLGSAANDGTGDTLRASGDKINDNFVEIYTLLGDGTSLSSGISATATVVTLTAPTISGVVGGTITSATITTLTGTTFNAGTLALAAGSITDSSGAISFGNENLTTTGSVTAASLDISGDVDIDGTLETDALTIAGVTLSETISDTVGTMVSSNTETNITVTYDDSDNTLDFVIGTLNQSTSGNAATATALETARTIHGVSFDGTANIDLSEVVQDTVGAMFSSNTETNITATYQDGDGTIDLVIGTLNQDTTGTAAIATTVTITDNESTNESNALIFTAGGDVDGGNLGLESDGTLTYNPSTGKVTATGFVGALTGNADTATALETARTIGGTSFDGTANIAVALAATATALATARTIGGVSFDGTANINLPGVNAAGNQNTSGTAAIATTVTITDNESTNESNALIFTAGGDVDGGNLGLESDGTLTYNPSTGKVTATGFVGTLTGNVTGNTSGTAATVTTAAQTNITSVGTLTALQVDNININGNAITSTAGTDLTITPVAGQQIVLDGAIVIDAGVVTGATSITSTAFVGDITGDVTGNADTATTLATARTIGGTSFDGSANIAVALATLATTVTITDNESTNESNALIFTAGGDVDGGNLGLESDGTLTYNPSTGKVTATGFVGTLTGAVTGDVTGNADTATALATARTIGGTSFDGSANIAVALATLATTATVSDSTANTNFPVVFNNESNALLDDTGALRYNPSTGTLLVPNLVVAGTTSTVDTVTMEAANAIIFEGATADAHETTLTIVDPTADRTINLPNQSGTVPVLAAASNTAITSTPSELNKLDGATVVVGEINALDLGSTAVGTAIASKAVVLDSSKDYTGIRNLTISGEIDAATGDYSGAVDIAGATTTAAITASGILKTDDTTAATSTTDGSLQTDGGLSVAADAVIGDDLFLLSDAAVLTFGADKDVTITHVADNGIMINAAMQLRFRDSAISIGSPADGDLDINADDEIELNSTLIDVNGNLDVSGTGVIAGAVTTAALTASGIIKTDDTTAATSTTDGSLQTDGGLSVAADAVIGDDLFMLSDAAVITFGADKDVTLTHVADAGVMLNAAMQLRFRDSAISIGSPADGDLDINADDEIELNSTLIDVNGNLDVSGTGVIAGAVTTAALTASGIIKTDDTTAATSTTDGSLQTDGGLSVVLDAVIGDDIILISDAAQIAFGANSEITLAHVHNVGLTLTHVTAGDNLPVVLQLKSEEDVVVANEVIGSIEFAAGDSDGTDGATVAAGIHAIAEDTFSASANATKLVFTTGVSETAASSATAKATLSSIGDFTIAGDLIIKDGGTIGSASDLDAIAIASNGVVTFSQIPVMPADSIDSDEYIDGSIDRAHLSADIIDATKIADDAIDSEHYTDGSIDTAHIADNQITLAKMAGLARGKIIVGDASGDPSALAAGTNGQVLASDGTDLAFADISVSSLAADNLVIGDAAVLLTTSSGNITIDAAANDSDIIFKGTDGGGDLVFATIDGSAAGKTTFNDEIVSGAVITSGAGLVIADAGNIGSASDTDAMSISSGGVVNFTARPTFAASLTIQDGGSLGSASDLNAMTISSGGVVAVTATTASTSATSGALTVAGGAGVAADLSVGDDLRLISDAAVLGFGADGDVTLTHVADTGLLLNAAMVVQFRDSAINIGSPADGDLDINADDEIELNSTLIDINGNLDVSGTGVIAGAVTTAALTASGIIKTDDTTAATSTTDGSLQTDGGLSVAADAVIGDDLFMLSDAAVITFGADKDVTLTHVADTGLLLNAAMAIQFRDSAISIASDNDGDLMIAADDEIDITSTLIDINGNVTISGTTGAAAVTTSTIVASGIIKTDDSTAATSTTDGSLQTDGGLSVVLDAVIGDDIILISDAAQIAFGANSEITLAHVHNVGLTLTHVTAGDNLPVVLQLKSEEDVVVANEVIGSIEFAAGDSDGTDGATVAAGIHAIAEDTFSASANATKLVFTTGVSETAASSATAKATLSSIGDFTVAGDLIIKDGGTIGSASDLDSIAIASDGVVTFSQAPVFPDGSIAVADLDIDGATDIGAAIVDADLFIIDDGAGGANRKTTAARIKTYIGASAAADDITAGDAAVTITTSSGNITIDAAANNSDVIFKGTDGGADITMLTLDGSADGAAIFKSTVTATGIIIGSTAVTSTAAELNALDGITAVVGELNALDIGGTSLGIALASKAVILDSNKDYTGIRNLTITGELDAATLDISGAIDIAGATATAAITASGIIKTDDATEATTTTDGSLQTDGGLSVAKDIVVGDDIKLLSDAAVAAFGTNGDVTLTHVHDTGLLLNAAMVMQFRDSAINIGSPADGDLDINADDEIELNSTLIDINGNVDISGTLAQADAITMATNKKIIFRDTAIHISSTADGDLSIAADDEIDLTSTLIDINGNVTISGTTGAAALTTSTIVASGIIKTDDSTAATSTTDGSLQTDGGLSVVLDAVIGDDIIMISDAAQIAFGANSEITLAHVHDSGLTLTHAATGDNLPVILRLKSEEDAIVANEVIASLEFAAGDSDGTDGATVAAGIHAIAEDTFSASVNKTKLVFTTGVSETARYSATPKATLSSIGDFTVAGDLIIKDGGTIGSASDLDALSISSGGVVNFTARPTFAASLTIQDGGSLGSASDLNAMTISSGGVVAVTAATASTSATSGALTVGGGAGIAADLSVGDDLFMISDAAVVTFGANKDVTLTHVHDTGLLLNAAMVVQFRDSAINIGSPADGDLDINADDEIELNSTLIDINGALDVSGNSVLASVDVTGVATAATFEPDGDTSSGDNAAIGYTSAEGLILTGQGSTSDITLKNDADATVFTVPTGTDDILFPDSAKAMFGAGSDLQIYHDGSHSYIDDAGSGSLYLRSNNIRLNKYTGEQMINTSADGAVTLFYNNAAKLATAGTGVTMTGEVTATGFTGTLDGVLGGGTAAAATTTTLASTTITASGIIKTDDSTAATSTTDGSLQTDGGLSVVLDAVIGDDIIMISDAAQIAFGANSEIALTHVHNVGLQMTSTVYAPLSRRGEDVFIVLDGTNAASANAGDNVILDASAASTDVGDDIISEDEVFLHSGMQRNVINIRNSQGKILNSVAGFAPGAI